MKNNRDKTLKLALVSILFGAIGWFASMELAVEYLKKLKNPDYVTNCEFSILVTCGPNMDSWQGSLFGFSNTFIGIAAFVAPVLVGVALLAGARFSSWFWHIYNCALLTAVVFVFWLSWQSVFAIGTLCPWCMVIWLVTIPLFWLTVPATVAENHARVSAGLRRICQFLHEWRWVLVILSYAAIAFYAQLGLDWITHVRLAFSGG
ncbi:vitamin K epoxide reductase family protein [Canibacter sp. lx-72]|uniref:vitamin K epoxide reductase family protein n=1 Tax=Canibacter zhuwentaonis TaxID=2837491 RepID=UPI001BDDAE03|nr:vitamin K epoxide reductase family protein [Canibacter zhuwentaonis]MBT1017711.1 vitamin K epoxide reductase family protein [Canibacter zhuwentaonis]MBT1034865.1 vitamin K epoxide reductase family protein [Canibacter zhuwentaonis]